MYDGECPKCGREVELDYYENEDECPYCRHTGYWDEEYNEYTYWMVWHWDE